MFKSPNMLGNIWNDLIHAGRSLAKARAFTLVCVVSLLPGVLVGVLLTTALIRLNGENMGIPLSNV